jgi:hypothetical protein
MGAVGVAVRALVAARWPGPVAPTRQFEPVLRWGPCLPALSDISHWARHSHWRMFSSTGHLE